MTVKKIYLSYKNYTLLRIHKFKNALKHYQRMLEDTSSLQDNTNRRERIKKIEEEIEKLEKESLKISAESQLEPVVFFDKENTLSWVYQDVVYQVKNLYSIEENKLLILDFVDKERRKFERLKKKLSGTASDELKYERLRIPEEVRIAVWRRDQGRCAKCGSRENLEYDHIVPVSKGGSNTARNIELLCQNCNRAKSNRIE